MRNPLVVRVLCIGLSVFMVAPLTAQNTGSSLLLQAEDDAQHGRYSSAKVEIEAAMAIDVSQAEPWYQLGLLDGQMADYRGAEQAFRHALSLDPRSAKAHCRLGQTLVAQPEAKEDWAGAVAEFKAALQLDPNYPEAESLLGLGLMHLGDQAAAIATLRHALELHPAQASAHLNLALVLEQQPEKQQEAVEEYRAALAAKPNAPETEAALGKLLLRMARLPEAEQAFRRALRLNPDLQDAHYGLSRVLKANKQLSEAGIEQGIATELGQRKPNSAQAITLNNEALQSAAKGDLPKSIAGLHEAIQLEPNYGIAKYNLGLVLADFGDYPAAKQQLIDAASLLPGQATIWFDLGRVFNKLGDRCRAKESFSWASRLAPANPKFARSLEELQSAHPGKENAEECSVPSGKPAFGAKADTAADRLAFARGLRAQGDLPGAMGELLRALELQPNAVDARVELAEVYAAERHWDRAIAEYRKVLLVADDEDGTVSLALGNVQLMAGQAKEALQTFDAVRRLHPHSAAALAGSEAARRPLP